MKDFNETTMDYLQSSEGVDRLLGNLVISQKYNNNVLEVIQTQNYQDKSKEPMLKRIVTDGKSFMPISLQSFNSSDGILELNFSDKITGTHQESGSKNITKITEKKKEDYFDYNLIPMLLPALPLKEGYSAKFPVYNYYAESDDKKHSILVVTVFKSDIKYSQFTGNHNVWQIMIYDTGTGKTETYYIEKETGKLWEIFYKDNYGDFNRFVNNESDYNPLKNKFDKDETLKLVTQGKSKIKGQAFAKDNNNKVKLVVTSINIGNKQFAPKGTTIVLIPYTKYFEEWNKANQPKKNSLYTPPTLPLPKGAEKCIVKTEVIDDEGNFEFGNLLPGKYLVTTTFDFGHTAYETTVIGYTDYFYNGYYGGTSSITKTDSYDVNLEAKIKKVVEIKENGETLEVKMKRVL